MFLDGFVGCMQEIQVQEMKVRPVEVVHSQLGVGVTVGACVLRDWCKINGSFCLNQGHCINDWADTYCDCSHTQYEGKYCQFGRHSFCHISSSNEQNPTSKLSIRPLFVLG